MDQASLYEFIRKQPYGVIPSTAADGTPQSALVGIACTPDLAIIFDTLKSTRKYRNLLRQPACSLVIGLSTEQTLQLDGLAEELFGDAREELLKTYFARWPECREHLRWPNITHFVVRPRWIRYSDYDQAPPLIAEFNL